MQQKPFSSELNENQAVKLYPEEIKNWLQSCGCQADGTKLLTFIPHYIVQAS